MPLYEYECEAGHRFERIQKFSDPPAEQCPTCGKPVHKLMSSPAFQFKGSGWYVTDYAKKDTKDTKETKDAQEGKDSSEKKDRKDSKETTPKETTSKETPKTSDTPSSSSATPSSSPANDSSKGTAKDSSRGS